MARVKRYTYMRARTFVAVALAVSLGSVASAQPQNRCTRETLSVRGTPLTAAYCITGIGTAAAGHDLPVQVAETYSTPRGSMSRNATLTFISGMEASRVIQDVPLDRLGMEGTLHLTLVLRGGLVHVESAMLTPGAITIK